MWLQVSQDKNKVYYELGLPVFLKIINQNMRSPYSKVTFLKELFVKIILINDMFDAYYRLVFDPVEIHVDSNNNKTILRWPAPKTVRSFLYNKSRYSHYKSDPPDFRTNTSQEGKDDNLGPSHIPYTRSLTKEKPTKWKKKSLRATQSSKRSFLGPWTILSSSRIKRIRSNMIVEFRSLNATS